MNRGADLVCPGELLVAALRGSKAHLRRDVQEWWAQQADVPVSAVRRCVLGETLCRWQWDRLDAVRRFPTQKLERREHHPNWGGNRRGPTPVVDAATGVPVEVVKTTDWGGGKPE